ncbi:uncharacterized protein T551_03620 [Pneumocystis jirovecii RU7]|uniref:Bromodomain associated domain-containing protein n=1 Tax=Pneumocystis jirovecii (strain RU7) TaxID=1408657 RepID=A0A0W4ZCA7_PNEJ7|nr:uncharacterized protein T551_03620 [Pneumocystis jirovecii RU7]KTW26048.1 hypothetical protein T551_03620 [Pneumocystis jirovecii RU7]
MRERFFFALARISAIQIMRSAGISRAKHSVTDSFTDIFIRCLLLLGTTAKHFAEMSGRPLVEMEDLRAAMETTGVLSASSGEDDVEPIKEFIEWCKSSSTAELRHISGQESTPDHSNVGWLDSSPPIILIAPTNDFEELMQKHIKEKFIGTVLDNNFETPIPLLADPRVVDLPVLQGGTEIVLKEE